MIPLLSALLDRLALLPSTQIARCWGGELDQGHLRAVVVCPEPSGRPRPVRVSGDSLGPPANLQRWQRRSVGPEDAFRHLNNPRHRAAIVNDVCGCSDRHESSPAPLPAHVNYGITVVTVPHLHRDIFHVHPILLPAPSGRVSPYTP